MSLSNDYFVLIRENNDDYPLVTWIVYHREFMLPHPVSSQPPVRLKVSDPVPRNPQFVDYHEGSIVIVSEKVKSTLDGIHGVQLVPATLDTSSVKLPYYILHVWKEIAAIDRPKSDCDFDDDGDMIRDVRSLTLSESVLWSIPLEERKVFLLPESTSTQLVHKTIVDKVLATNPVGLRFLPLASWNSNSSFH